MSTLPNNLSPEDIEDLFNPITRKILANQLLEMVDPLTLIIIKRIKPILADYILEVRKSMLKGTEFSTIPNASKLSGIPTTTIYTWISKGMLEVYPVSPRINIISLSQFKNVMKDYVGHHKKSKPVQNVLEPLQEISQLK